ncbi:MAG TPA: hypothetical protein VF670_15015 [Duganella sp.]|jgi:hypothetical protein
MSNLSALGARALPASYTAATPPNDGKPAGALATQKSNGAASSPLSLSSNALDMQKRVASVGNATIDFAQDLMSSFTQALFGDAAKGATIDFDSASLEASSSYALGVQQSAGPNGTSSLAAFSLTDSSHFIGKGTITTADGRKFDFEVEVQYDFQLDAAASQTNSGSLPQSDKVRDKAANAADNAAADKAGRPSRTGAGADLPTVQLPNIDFAGTLADLFQLIGRDLQSALSTSDDIGQNGEGVDRNALRSLSLRLLNLVDSKDAGTYTAPTPADQAKSAAAYGGQAGAPGKLGADNAGGGRFTGGPSGSVDPAVASAPAADSVAKPVAMASADSVAADSPAVDATNDDKGAAGTDS